MTRRVLASRCALEFDGPPDHEQSRVRCEKFTPLCCCGFGCFAEAFTIVKRDRRPADSLIHEFMPEIHGYADDLKEA
jgi:hypothetical protein